MTTRFHTIDNAPFFTVWPRFSKSYFLTSAWAKTGEWAHKLTRKVFTKVKTESHFPIDFYRTISLLATTAFAIWWLSHKVALSVFFQSRRCCISMYYIFFALNMHLMDLWIAIIVQSVLFYKWPTIDKNTWNGLTNFTDKSKYAG